MVGDLEKSSFSNIEQQSLEFVKYTLDPWVSDGSSHWCGHFFRRGEEKVFFKFNVEGLLRGDYESRMNGYATARQNGWMSANDIRELENLDRIPAEGGDLYLINGNMLPLTSAGAAYANKEEMENDQWKKQKKFWEWKNQADEGSERVLELYGTIAEVLV